MGGGEIGVEGERVLKFDHRFVEQAVGFEGEGKVLADDCRIGLEMRGLAQDLE